MAEKVRVLIVDDSSFFRGRIRRELEQSGEIAIVGEAGNGREAVDAAVALRPDLITMDVAMPVMDGIAAVREIMVQRPTDIIMFSALTRDGASATLEALEAGAVDFMPKLRGDRAASAGVGENLRHRVISIARSRSGRYAAKPRFAPSPRVRRPRQGARVQLVVIGASTGGPVAVQRVLAALSADYPLPILVAVHMPAEFTATFADRLDAMCHLRVRHAADGDALVAGQALIAPGGMQTLVERRGGVLKVRVMPGGEQLYKPSVDILFGSAARVLQDAVQAVVLTGMGADGTEGARLLKQGGAAVWSQDEPSCVVYGMPWSVVKAGHSDRVIPLDEIGLALGELN
ncbi:MAG: chemotaxis response regulator protein-glutamate methylesterase [Chromatiaceae bacterium]|jgi:two-component system chemotaxis response regulator CheB